MQEIDIQAIQQAEREIKMLSDIKTKFELTLKAHGAFNDFAGQVNLRNGIYVHCFGVDVHAKSRIVRRQVGGEFLLDVVFNRKRGEKLIYVAGFYVGLDGIVRDSHGGVAICNHDAPEVSREIFTRVAEVVLHSDEFDISSPFE